MLLLAAEISRHAAKHLAPRHFLTLGFQGDAR
jgi:hypothetical protein